MKNVVITGGSRGIGYGLADGFLARGCSVVISGREQGRIDEALGRLREAFPGSGIIGVSGDVRQADQVQALWTSAVQAFDSVDIWVNNAGISGDESPLWELPPQEAAAVIQTNIIGTIHGCQTAIQGMLKQGHGAIYNMEGLGSDGRMHKGLTSYGASKYAVSYLTRALAKELKGTPLIIGSLRPGMVVTDLLFVPYRDRPEEFERVKRIFNIIAERLETVTPWLVDRMLTNMKSGAVLSFTRPSKLFWRFLTAPFVKRDLFSDR